MCLFDLMGQYHKKQMSSDPMFLFYLMGQYHKKHMPSDPIYVFKNLRP